MSSIARLLRFKPGKTSDDVASVLTHLVRGAGRHVPYYRNLLREAATDSARFDAASKLTAFPPSGKRDLREPPEQSHLRAGRDPRHCASRSTSGTTGERLTVYMSRAELYFRRLSLLSAFRHYIPIHVPLRVADVGPLLVHRRSPIEERLGLVDVLRIPGDAPIVKQRAALSAYRPTLVQGFPTCLETLARGLSDEEVERLHPLLVGCRGETLREGTRGLLERVFRTRVVDLYNCEEVGNMAWECPDHVGRFHVNHDTCVLEVLDEQGNPTDRQGDIAVTNLYNWTMPFLRYRIEDKGTLRYSEEPCTCGASGPWLENLETQQYDSISIPDGRLISPRVLKSILFHAIRSTANPHRLIPQVHRYQLVQQADYSLRVLLDWQGPPDAVLSERIVSDVERVSLGLRCRVEMTSELELTPAGKFKVIQSRIPVDVDTTT